MRFVRRAGRGLVHFACQQEPRRWDLHSRHQVDDIGGRPSGRGRQRGDRGGKGNPAGSGGPTGGVFGLPTGGFPLRRDEGLETLDFQGDAIQYCYLEIGRVSMTKGLRLGVW